MSSRRPTSRVPTCHPERKYFARYMCQSCWHKWDRKTNRNKRLRLEAKNREQQRPNRRTKRRWWRYRVTQERFDEMLKQQESRCAICRIELADMPLPKMHVDHDHVTDMVRGLLCFNCNSGLGQFKDSIERLEAAVTYLRAYKT